MWIQGMGAAAEGIDKERKKPISKIDPAVNLHSLKPNESQW